MDINNFLITCIIARGEADKVMSVARQAGARGGTILPARGTGTEDDRKFLGIPMMLAEKEVLLIVANCDQLPAIVDAIRNKLSSYKKIKGSSNVVYTTPIGDFFTC
jgi:nitrogen regulatory protein PII